MTSSPALKHVPSSNYRLLGLVGRGQFGQVYCAIHRKTGRWMALKNLNRDRLPTHRFLRELRFLLSLDHPHIANCYALEHSATGRQLVLDYCEGGTLRDLLEQEVPLTLGEILTLMVEVLSALEHAHNQGIVHCDIKPENILLSLTVDGWQAKVSDFGIARLSQELQGDRSGATGSPAYMAPERFYHRYSEASDLYAVGIVLYELLLGDRPFSGNHRQLMIAHLNHTVPIPDTLPAVLQSLLHKALEKLIARRFASATAMRQALLSACQSLTAATLAEPFPKRRIPVTCSSFQPQQQRQLSTAAQAVVVTRLVTRAHATVLVASDQHLWGWTLSATGTLMEQSPGQTWLFNAPIRQVFSSPRGATIVASKTLYALEDTSPPRVIARFPDPVQGIAGSYRRTIVQSLTQSAQFWLVDSQQQVPESPHPFQLSRPDPAATLLALMLDRRHVVIAEIREYSTRLRVLTRWGKELGALALKTPIHQLFPSQASYQVLAQAGRRGTDLLVIRLKPFRVMRCRLDAPADWIGELSLGYVSISKQGQMRIVNFQGQLIGQIDQLPPASAIAFHPPYHIWLVTEQSTAPKLHGIDIRHLDLEIVF